MTPDVSPQDKLEVARTYASWGWHSFPVVPLIEDKLPAIKGWPDLATTDLAQIEQWWGREFVGYNIGIVTGERSNLLVIDVDNGPGKFGEDNLDTLCERLGKLPDTPTVLTPHGGRHLYFAWPGFNPSQDALGKDIDVQGNGRFVVAPPSVSADGVYCWEQSLRPSSWFR